MHLVVRHVAIALLSSAYLTASCATLLLRTVTPWGSSGPERVDAASPSSREQPRVTWTPHRHMPMVKEVSASPLVPARVHLQSDLRHDALVRTTGCHLPVTDLYYSSLADRAPPAA